MTECILDLWCAGLMRDKDRSTVNQDMEPAARSISTPIPGNPGSFGFPAFGVPPFSCPLSTPGAAAASPGLSIIDQGWSQAGASAPALLSPPGAGEFFRPASIEDQIHCIDPTLDLLQQSLSEWAEGSNRVLQRLLWHSELLQIPSGMLLWGFINTTVKAGSSCEKLRQPLRFVNLLEAAGPRSFASHHGGNRITHNNNGKPFTPFAAEMKTSIRMC